jgi:hypothetical protein
MIKKYLRLKKVFLKNLDKTKEFLSEEVKSIDISLKEDLISNIDSKLKLLIKR